MLYIVPDTHETRVIEQLSSEFHNLKEATRSCVDAVNKAEWNLQQVKKHSEEVMEACRQIEDSLVALKVTANRRSLEEGSSRLERVRTILHSLKEIVIDRPEKRWKRP
jgi:methyl-accepting chemotaxis protein